MPVDHVNQFTVFSAGDEIVLAQTEDEQSR